MKYSDSKDSFIYFYQGIFMKSALDYTTCMTTSINFDLLQLSYVSRYPIINLKLKSPSAFLDGKIATETYLPLLGTSIYNIGAGRLESYLPLEDDNSKYILEIDQPLIDLQEETEEEEGVKEDEILSISQYKDEILSEILPIITLDGAILSAYGVPKLNEVILGIQNNL